MKAIDIHVHAGIGPDPRGVAEMAQHHRQIDVLALPIAWDEESRSGRPRLDNDTLGGIVKDHSDVFIGGWACIDPWKGQTAINDKYFPESLKGEVDGRLQDRALFGSDHPFVPVARWLSDFEKEGYKPEVMEKVLYTNAQRVLGLTTQGDSEELLPMNRHEY